MIFWDIPRDFNALFSVALSVHYACTPVLGELKKLSVSNVAWWLGLEVTGTFQRGLISTRS